MKKIIFVIFFLKLSSALSYYQVLDQVDQTNQYYIIDMRARSGNETEYFENSVHFEWQQLSQLGLPSRGYIKSNVDSLVSDLSDLGIHPDKKIVIIGRGIRGRGEEGRVAYTLVKIGFKEVFISTGQFLRDHGFKSKSKAPPHILKSALFKVKINNDLALSRVDMKSLLRDKPKKISCIDLRPKNNLEQAFNLKYFCKKIEWRSFFTRNMKIDLLIAAELDRQQIKKEDQIILLSEAGLSSGGITLAMRELGYRKAVNFEGGYSDLRALMFDSNILSERAK
ncbi:MAG: hypothetical protein H7328_08265 [Bdellovibrio sp.]|nr:hypothetical protein [Bdellovibrio sp.]